MMAAVVVEADPVSDCWGDPEGAIQALVLDEAITILTQNGRTMVPLFQFDVANGRIFDGVGDILRHRPDCVSNLMLCYLLTSAHVDFGC